MRGQRGPAADAWPTKPVRIIVPFPPGGPADVLARTVGDRIAPALGQPVVVDNRPGAGGNIGMELAAKAPPDGHTLVLAPAGNLTVNPSLYRNVPYDVARDFAPVTVIAAVPNVLVVNPQVPAKDLAELIAYAKANPGKLNFSSPGPGQRRAPRWRAPQEQRGHRHRARAVQRHRAGGHRGPVAATCR